METNNGDILLSVRQLTTKFKINGRYYAAVDSVSFDIRRGEVFAIVGESGSGKTALVMSILQLHGDTAQISGNVIFNTSDTQKNLVSMTERELVRIRGKEIGMVFQDPLTALNPVMRVGVQIEEALACHLKLGRRERKEKTLQLLANVAMPEPVRVSKQFPHELSGGMRQRAMMAIALACEPTLLLADEPTTALDVTVQAQILKLMRELQQRSRMSILLVTHDLGVVAEAAERVAVMYAGQIVEVAHTSRLFSQARHPYTRALLASASGFSKGNKRLHVIPGVAPTLSTMPRQGCRFANRMHSTTLHEPLPTLHEIFPGHLVLCTCHQELTNF